MNLEQLTIICVSIVSSLLLQPFIKSYATKKGDNLATK